MDSGNFVEYCLPKLADAILLFGISLALFQCCPPKKKPRRPEKYDVRSHTITNSSRSKSRSVEGSPDKSPMSPSPSKRSKSRTSKHRKSAEDADKKKKKKSEKKRSAESGKKHESRRSSRRGGSVEKDEELPVQSTQPTLPLSSDPDSVGTARIEIITFPITVSPAKKPPPPPPPSPTPLKKASHEPASAEKKSKEIMAGRKQSQEIVPTGRRQSRETMRDPFAVQMKQSKECERANTALTAYEMANNF